MRSIAVAYTAVLLSGLVGAGSASAAVQGVQGRPGEMPLAGPVEEVAIVLDHPVELGSLAGTLSRLNLTPISFSHITDHGAGGNVSRGMSMESAVEKYRSNYRYLVGPGEPRITRFSVLGPVPQLNSVTLGLPATVVAGPARGLLPSGRKGTVLPINPIAYSVPDTGARSGRRPDELMPTQGSPPAPAPPRVEKWAPIEGRFEAKDAPNNRRLMAHQLRWSDQASIDDFGAGRAYEHDFKLINEGNNGGEVAGVGTSPVCAPWQANNFWAAASNVTFDTNVPVDVVPYLDTSVLDSCKNRDFTIGFYHPNKLKPAVDYMINVVADKGDFDASPYALTGQRLEKLSDGCENPWCVGVTPGGLPQRLVGVSKGVAPGCRRWAKGRDSDPC